MKLRIPATAILLSGIFLINCTGQSNNQSTDIYQMTGNDYPEKDRIEKSSEAWKAELDPFVYYITRQKGTERAFTGAYWDHKESGTYNCSNCDLPLFSSDSKFKSGTGWPSYYEAIEEANIAVEIDSDLGMKRVEILCGRCGAHLGHVFNDGPEPTGLRYCVNSASLDFEAK